MIQAKNGDKVQVHYTGKLDDGTIFDSSETHEPLGFTIGAAQVIPGFEHAVIGMELGQSKTVRIAADEAYGPYQEEMIIQVARSEFPEDMQVEIGQQFHMIHENDEKIIVTVKELTESSVTLDANHPLAGEDLTFDIELVKIN